MKVENDSVDHKLSYIKSQILSIIITYMYCSEKFGPLTNLNTKKKWARILCHAEQWPHTPASIEKNFFRPPAGRTPLLPPPNPRVRDQTSRVTLAIFNFKKKY